MAIYFGRESWGQHVLQSIGSANNTDLRLHDLLTRTVNVDVYELYTEYSMLRYEE